MENISSETVLSIWNEFYKEIFGKKIDIPFVFVPEDKDYFDFPIIIIGIKIQELYDKCKELFSCRSLRDGDLDEMIISSRSREQTYVVWIRDRIEADEELKGLSAKDLSKRNISGITLEERLILELNYFWRTGNHLDIKSITLCSGSCYIDGGVPGVYYWQGCNQELRIIWCHPEYQHFSVRSRRVKQSLLPHFL